MENRYNELAPTGICTRWSFTNLRTFLKDRCEGELRANQSPCGPVSFVQGRRSLHPTDEDLSVGTPTLHPTDEDLSVGTPTLIVASTLVWCFRDTPTLVSL
jgi:hypothetical protein